jgi:hypothetical protein
MVSGCDSVSNARSLLCSYVGGARFITCKLSTQMTVNVDQLAKCMDADLKKQFKVSVRTLDVFNDTNCLLFTATAAAAAGVPLLNFRALVPAVLALKKLPNTLIDLIVDHINTYLAGEDVSSLIDRFSKLMC